MKVKVGFRFSPTVDGRYPVPVYYVVSSAWELFQRAFSLRNRRYLSLVAVYTRSGARGYTHAAIRQSEGRDFFSHVEVRFDADDLRDTDRLEQLMGLMWEKILAYCGQYPRVYDRAFNEQPSQLKEHLERKKARSKQ